MNFARTGKLLLLLIASFAISTLGCFEEGQILEPEGDALSLSGDNGDGSPESLPGIQSPGELCEKLTAISCRHIYECLSTREREQAGLAGVKRERCKEVILENGACDAQPAEFECPPGTWFHREEVQKCVKQNAELSCSEFQSGRVVPSCTRFCQTTPLEGEAPPPFTLP